MDERPELQRELDRRDEEIRRLRALLVAKDAELGEVKGHMLELEGHIQLLISIARQVQRVAPGAPRLASSLLRRMRARRGAKRV